MARIPAADREWLLRRCRREEEKRARRLAASAQLPIRLLVDYPEVRDADGDDAGGSSTAQDPLKTPTKMH